MLGTGWQLSPYSLILGVAAMLTALVGGIVWHRRSVAGSRPFALLLVAAAEWASMAALEHASVGPATKVLFAKMEYPGILSIPPLWLTFVLLYTKHDRWLGARLVMLWILPVATLGLVSTNEWHGLIWNTIGPSSLVPGAPLVYGHGPWFWVLAAYGYALNLAGAILLLRVIASVPTQYGRQSTALVVGLLIPWIGNGIYLSGWSPLGGVDLTPLSFGLTGVVYTWGVFRLRLFDLVPIARHALVESMSDGLLVVDAENRVIDVNPSARRLIGLGNARVVGENAATILAPWPAVDAASRDLSRTRNDVRVDTSDGPRHLDLAITPLHDARGQLRGRLIGIRDVTEREQAKERLRLQSLALDEAGTAIFITGRDGRITWVNQAFVSLTGWEPDDAVGRTPRILESGAHPRAFYRRMRQTVLGGAFWRGEIVNRRRDGWLFTVEATIAPVHDDRGGISHFITVMHDVTERKAVEQMRDDLRRALVHDLRDPLTNIRTSLDALSAAWDEGAPVPPQGALEIASWSALRMWKLLDSILDIHRLETGQMTIQRERLRLEQLVREALATQAPLAAQKGLELVNAVGPDAPLVDVDGALISRVLQNLVDNAIRFTPTGGVVSVAAEHKPGADHATLSVVDTGIGVTAAMQRALFERPSPGQSPGRGLGFGLVFCRLAVEAHGCRIAATSAGRRGAAFRFTVPVAK